MPRPCGPVLWDLSWAQLAPAPDRSQRPCVCRCVADPRPSESRARTRQERAFFQDGVLQADSAQDLTVLLDKTEGTFLPIECTGFSRLGKSERVQAGGTIRTGTRPPPPGVTVTAAREQLSACADRPLTFAIDVAGLAGQRIPAAAALRPRGGARSDVRLYGGAGAQHLRLPQRNSGYACCTTGPALSAATRSSRDVFDFVRGGGPFGGSSYLLVEAVPDGLGKSAVSWSASSRARPRRRTIVHRT